MENNGFQLKWPLNWMLAGAFVLGAGHFIGYLWSALIAGGFLWWLEKQHPHRVPQGGYCLDRTRKQLARLGYALLFLVIGAGCAVVFYSRLQEDRTGWDAQTWLTLAVAGVFGLGALLLCLYETFTSLRDALFPGHSRLARSIRAHLPPADQLLDTAELFELVDRDLRENGQWFDRVCVGREWVFGDEVSAISRIRVVSGQNETTLHHRNGRTTSDRTIQLHILDDRQKVQLTALRNAAELQPLLDCIRLRAPEALFCPYSQLSSYTSMSEVEWEELERSFQQRRAQRLQREEVQQRSAAQASTDFVLADLRGRRTSVISREILERQLEGVRGPGDRFALEPTEPIPCPPLGWLCRMECGGTETGIALAAVVKRPDGSFLVCAQPVQREGAAYIMKQLLERRQVPGLSDWKPLPAAPDGSVSISSIGRKE